MGGKNSNHFSDRLAGLGVPEVGVRARGELGDEELQQAEDEGEPGHLRLGSDRGRVSEDRSTPTAQGCSLCQYSGPT